MSCVVRVVDHVELVLRGGSHLFEQDLGTPELLGDGKRSYFLYFTHPVLERLRFEKYFASHPDVYMALAYQTTRAMEPTAVVGHDGVLLKPYRKGEAAGPETVLRWVHKSLYLCDDLPGGGKSVSGWHLDLSVPGMIRQTLSVECTAEGREFINNAWGGWS